MSLARNTALTSVGSLLALVSGVILDGIIVAFFGLGRETDAYFVASLIPFAVITILHLQAGKVIQPVFVHAWNTEGPAEAWRFLRATLTLGTCVVMAVGLGFQAASPLLMKIQAPGYSDSTRALATELCLYFFLIPVLYAPIVFMKEALIGVGDFVLPGSIKIIENLTKILFAVLLVGKLGIFALPIGMVVGALLQAAVLYVGLSRRGFRYHPTLNFRDAKVTRAIRLLGYPMVGHVSSIVTEVVQNILASLLGSGTVSALRLGTRIVDGFAGLLANSIVVVVMPMVTHSLSRNDPERMKAHIRDGIRLLLLLSIPASVWLLGTHKALIALLFERMKFSSSDTHMVSSLLLLMIPYIFLSRLFGLAETGFYGSCDTRTPLLGSLTIAAVYIVLMLVLISPLNALALPTARSLAYLFASALMLRLLYRRFGSVGLRSLTMDAAKIVAASGALLLGVAFGHIVTGWFNFSGVVLKGARFVLPSAFGFLGFGIASLLLRIVSYKSIRRALMPAGIGQRAVVGS